jgi:hypothetical protein
LPVIPPQRDPGPGGLHWARFTGAGRVFDESQRTALDVKSVAVRLQVVASRWFKPGRMTLCERGFAGVGIGLGGAYG